MNRYLLLIGSEGNLGKKIKKHFSDSKTFNKIIEIDIHNYNSIESICTKKEENSITAIIATPPKTHIHYVKQLLMYKSIINIFCEKPFPDISLLKTNKSNKVQIIDHYLYKDNISEIKIFLTNQKLIKKLSYFYVKLQLKLDLGCFINLNLVV